jgi:hypothetical protein
MVLHPAQEFFHIYGDVTIAGKRRAAKFRPMLGGHGL